ncbi:MAG: VTT domain-containing protein [Bryobacterales bacterium]|nr:VTT domain-containing protein [Bryobacteraceae bacterium]MDW8355106.1 VTT domain-containing protein [Bryobacterales bacterium]
MLDSAGLPLPATVDALLIAVAASEPALAFLSAGLAVAGSTAGCMVLYFVARKGGELYWRRHVPQRRAQTFLDWFRRYGLATVFVPAFSPIPLPTKAFIIAAGVFGVGAVPFLLVILAARIPRYFGLAWLGAQFGESTVQVWLLQHAWHAAAAMALAAALVALALRRLRGSR